MISEAKNKRSLKPSTCGAVWRRFERLLAVLTTIIALQFTTPSAGLADIYEIKNLGVDATAKDAQQAKIAALKSGQEAAFNLLVKRLAVVDDPAKLPQFTSAEVARLLAGLTIEEEKTSSTRYIAKLTVRFRAELVKKFLSQFKIPFADQQAAPVLLLAVWEVKPNPVLWDSPNPWRDGWSKIDAANSITPITIPLGDLTDIAMLSAQDALAGESEKVDQLKARYGTDHAIIARAKPSGDGTAIIVNVQGTSPMGPIEFIETYPVTERNYSGVSFQVARDFLAALELRWKQENQNGQGRPGQVYSIAVPFSSLQEWQSLRSDITAANGVGGVEIQSLSARGALVKLKFGGDADALVEELALRGLSLTNVGDAWVLERR